MNARRLDLRRHAAATAHADAEAHTTDREAARRYGTSRRTHNRWMHDGPPVLHQMVDYIAASSNPWRVLAMLNARVKELAIRKLSTPDLIARYRDVVRVEVSCEADDRTHDIDPTAGWLDCATVSERDAAIDAEKAAIERELELRCVTRAKVLGGAV